MSPRNTRDTLSSVARKAKSAIKSLLHSKPAPQPQSPDTETPNAGTCPHCRACEMAGGCRGKLIVDPLRFHPIQTCPGGILTQALGQKTSPDVVSKPPKSGNQEPRDQMSAVEDGNRSQSQSQEKVSREAGEADDDYRPLHWP